LQVIDSSFEEIYLRQAPELRNLFWEKGVSLNRNISTLQVCEDITTKAMGTAGCEDNLLM